MIDLQNNFIRKTVALFSIILMGFGGGGLLGLMLAYGLEPTSIKLDVEKTAALGAIIGMCTTLLMLLQILLHDFIKQKTSLNS